MGDVPLLECCPHSVPRDSTAGSKGPRENVPPKASELSSVPPTQVEISIPVQTVECVSFP